MKTQLISSIIILSILYVVMQHIYNHLWRKYGLGRPETHTMIDIGLVSSYLILTAYYWFFLINSLKFIFKS